MIKHATLPSISWSHIEKTTYSIVGDGVRFEKGLRSLVVPVRILFSKPSCLSKNEDFLFAEQSVDRSDVWKHRHAEPLVAADVCRSTDRSGTKLVAHAVEGRVERGSVGERQGKLHRAGIGQVRDRESQQGDSRAVDRWSSFPEGVRRTREELPLCRPWATAACATAWPG